MNKKKKLIALLLVVMPMLCLAQWDNNKIQFPEANFRSVNTYNTGTTYKPPITPVGSTTVYGTNSNTDNTPYQSRPRKVGEYPEDPYATPIGDVPIMFMVIFVFLFQCFKNYYYDE
jgi:hypothetical protein